MSDQSPSTHEAPALEQIGPYAQLIAEALGRLGLSEHKAAQRITDAAYDIAGNRTTIHASTVSRWLSGNIAQPRLRKWTAVALDIPLRDLNAAADAQRKLQCKYPARAVNAPTPDLAVESDDVKRRAFAQLLALGGMSVVSGIDFDRYAAVLAGARADDRALDDFERITLDLIRQEATATPSALMPAVRGHLAGLRDVLVWTPPALAPRAYSLAGQAALLAGYLQFQQDDYAEADTYWTLADRFGEQAGDGRLRAALLELRASRWSPPFETDNLPAALALLDRAVALIGPSPDPASAAYILSFRARKHAEASRTLPDHDALAMRDLDNVQTYLTRIPSADASVYIVGSVVGETVQGHARALVHLGRSGEAVAHLERLLASIEHQSLSWRAGIIADLAAARAATGEHEHASDLLIMALRLADQAAAGRKLRRVRQARQRWLAGHDGPALRRLDDELRLLPPRGPSAHLPPAASA
jgi:tetratricopeptide (TPR) repeat protein